MSASVHSVDLVLHLGSGKTGTTSVQTFLSRNRDRLAELGFLYPASPGMERHTRLSLSILPEELVHRAPAWQRQGFSSVAQFRETFRAELRAEIAEAALPRMIMSDEALFGTRDEARERLRVLTDEIARSVRLVVYLRRQDDHVASRYQQVVKVGETRRLEERVRNLRSSDFYNYRKRLGAWRRAMRPTSFVVRPFEQARFSNGSLYQDFLDSAGVGVHAHELEPVMRFNESLNAEAVEFLRIFNLYRVENRGARVGLVNNRPLLPRLRAASQAEPGPTLTLSPDLTNAFMARWEESNRAVARDFLGDPSGQLFSSPRKTDDTTSDQVLDPARLDYYLELLELPERLHRPLRTLVEREATTS